jgi:hypothetical protein
MAEFMPEDGVVYFAWRNAFHRVAERTYDWVYRRSDVVDDGGYFIQEIPYQRDDGDAEWVRLIHERTFDTEERVSRYCAVLLRKFAAVHGTTVSPPRTLVAHSRAPGSSSMYYDNGTIVLPAPSSADAHEDPTGEPENRDRFIASRWMDQQHRWPIAEHHLLHELAHHVSKVDHHDGEFVEAFVSLLAIASEGKNFSSDIWRWEFLLAQRLLEAGEAAVDLVTGAAYEASGQKVSDGARILSVA